MKYDAIVIGAGMAGLMAARELGRAGKRVLILEARDRIGGRVYPLPVSEFGYEAQGGGEFVHGDAPVTVELLKECSGTLQQVTEWWHVFDEAPKRLETDVPADPRLLDALSTLDSDMTVQEFFDRHFAAEEYADMRETAYRWVEGYDAADPTRASVIGLRDDMMQSSRWHQRSIKEGYGLLLRHLEKQCTEAGVEIQLEKEVVAVHLFDANAAEVRTAENLIYQGTQVLVTVPLPCIKDIAFTPVIPEKIKAACKIGYGGVIKILLRFRTKWWTGAREKNFERLFFMFSKEKVPTWWTQYPEQHLTLTGWLAGPKAEALRNESETALISTAIDSLANIFEVDRTELESNLIASRAVHWGADSYARGAYSYTTPESAEAIRILREPVQDTLYFAGEALNKDDNIATVEAALESGRNTAHRMLS